MELRRYLESAPRGAAAELSRQMAVSPVMVSQYASGEKAVPPWRCVQIEAATSSAVMRWDLRPDDWHRIWPELIGIDGAPPVPAVLPPHAAAA